MTEVAMCYLDYKSLHHLQEQPAHSVLTDNLHANSRDHTAAKNIYISLKNLQTCNLHIIVQLLIYI